MPSVHLDDEDWQKVMAIIAQAPWNVANPLLMRVGEQLRAQSVNSRSTLAQEDHSSGRIQEVPAAEAQLSSKGAH